MHLDNMNGNERGTREINILLERTQNEHEDAKINIIWCQTQNSRYVTKYVKYATTMHTTKYYYNNNMGVDIGDT